MKFCIIFPLFIISVNITTKKYDNKIGEICYLQLNVRLKKLYEFYPEKSIDKTCVLKKIVKPKWTGVVSSISFCCDDFWENEIS